MTEQIPDLINMLTMLANGLGIGTIIALLAERSGIFQTLPPQGKWWIVFVISLGLPILAKAALQFVPPDVWFLLEPWWQTVAGAFMIWVGSQYSHKLLNK